MEDGRWMMEVVNKEDILSFKGTFLLFGIENVMSRYQYWCLTVF